MLIVMFSLVATIGCATAFMKLNIRKTREKQSKMKQIKEKFFEKVRDFAHNDTAAVEFKAPFTQATAVARQYVCISLNEAFHIVLLSR